jgi:hypothetical protein
LQNGQNQQARNQQDSHLDPLPPLGDSTTDPLGGDTTSKGKSGSGLGLALPEVELAVSADAEAAARWARSSAISVVGTEVMVGKAIGCLSILVGKKLINNINWIVLIVSGCSF